MSVIAPKIDEVFADFYFNRIHEMAGRLRDRGPVIRAVMPDGLPVYVITGYSDVRAALNDPRLSKNRERMIEIVTAKLAEAGRLSDLSALYSPHMLLTDPPDHTRLRALLARGFTARRVESLRPRIEQLVTELLDALPTDRPVDLIARFALPLPATVIAELMGVPATDRLRFQGWALALNQQRPEVSLPASREIVAYLSELIEDKARNPADDLLSALVATSGSGDRLSPDELLATALLLLVAGHETTADLIGNALRWILDDPDLARRLRERPDSVRPAVEELLRFDPPVMMSTNRFSAEPIEIGGVTIPAGEIVLMSLGSANRDERHFDRPDALDIGRDTGGHMAFGHGIHYCIGAPLARLEGEIAVGRFVQRFPAARLAVPAEELRRQVAAILNGFAELPARLSP